MVQAFMPDHADIHARHLEGECEELDRQGARGRPGHVFGHNRDEVGSGDHVWQQSQARYKERYRPRMAQGLQRFIDHRFHSRVSHGRGTPSGMLAGDEVLQSQLALRDWMAFAGYA